MRTPSAYRYGSAYELGQLIPEFTLPPFDIPSGEPWTMPPGGVEPDQPNPNLPSIPNLPNPPEQQEEKKEPPWLALALVSGCALLAVALWNR
jgi:hypothetical protein